VSANTLWLLDFDRCLGGVKTPYDDAHRVLDGLELGKDVPEAQARVEAAGGSFDFIGYLAEHQPAKAKVFLQKYAALTATKPSEYYRNDGATELLESLQRARVPYMILTYGGRDWQRAKLRAAGLAHEPQMIISGKEKGELIAEWYNDARQCFVVPMEGGPEMFTRIVLVDDKAVSFAGLPAQASGYWLCAGPQLPSQKGSVPVGVQQIDSLHQLVTSVDF